MRIAVVGAGITGLCVSAGLQSSGADVTIFERSDDMRPEGSGLSIFGNGMKALDYLGLGARVRTLTDISYQGKYVPYASRFVGGLRSPNGGWFTKVPAGQIESLRVVERSDLHAILSSAVIVDSVRTNAPVIKITETGKITTANGHFDSFDLVIGADGLRSVVRSCMPFDTGVKYAGYSAWRGITDQPVPLNWEAGETWGNGARFGIAPLSDGRVYWFATRSGKLTTGPADIPGALLDEFSDWHAPVAELITQTENIQCLPIFELANTPKSFIHGRTVLIGDAAHAMTPNLGQGGNIGIEDAAQLVHCLADIADAPHVESTDLFKRLNSYDLLRRPRAKRIALASRRVGRLAQASSPLLVTGRNAALRAVPSRVFRNQVESVQRWELTSI